MTHQRLIALLLIIIQANALGYFSGTVVFPVVMVAVALAGVIAPRRIDLSHRQALVAGAVLAVLFAVKLRFAPHVFSIHARGLLSPMAYAAAQYFLVLQVVQFHIRRGHDALPSVLPALGVVVMVGVADIRATVPQQRLFFLLALCYAVCGAFFIAASGPRRSIGKVARVRGLSLITVVGLTALLSWVSVASIYRYGQGIDRWLARFLQPHVTRSSPGFSHTAQLGSVQRQKATQTNKVMLRIYGKESPGYVRGMAFDTYELSQSRWQVQARARRLQPTADTAEADRSNAVVVYHLHDQQSTNSTRLEFWPDDTLVGNFLLPLNTTRVETPVEAVIQNEHQIVTTEDLLPGYPYKADVALPPAAEPANRYLQRLTRLPHDLDPRLGKLAAEICNDCRSTADKLAAVEDYFHGSYRYQVGISIPRGVDPVTHFLLHRPPAHCEYFASGAAILLRLQGVPCRYVTGFVASGRNDYGEYWLARNGDAHAWVEAYDEQSKQWIIVEATPASGVPSSKTPSRFSEAWDYVSHKLRQFRVSWQQGGVRWLLGQIGQHAVLTTLLLLVPVVWFLLKRTRHVDGDVRTSDPVVAELQRLLARVDRRMARLGLRRQPGETLHQFAERIATDLVAGQSAAAWYRDYATARYGGTEQKDVITDLAQLPDLSSLQPSRKPASGGR